MSLYLIDRMKNCNAAMDIGLWSGPRNIESTPVFQQALNVNCNKYVTYMNVWSVIDIFSPKHKYSSFFALPNFVLHLSQSTQRRHKDAFILISKTSQTGLTGLRLVQASTRKRSQDLLKTSQDVLKTFSGKSKRPPVDHIWTLYLCNF